ncbi:unnamed protein product [Urochloa humidicola]
MNFVARSSFAPKSDKLRCCFPPSCWPPACICLHGATLSVLLEMSPYNLSDDGEPCIDIDVNLEVTLEVYTEPFSMLPLSAVEKPGNLLMQGLLDRLVPILGEQLLRDYYSWVQQQPEASS